VLLSGRGEAEAERAEQAVSDTGAGLTIVRSTWFAQNFSEGAFVDFVLAGEVALPAGDTPEPFVDVDDIADVAVAALTDDRHVGERYELTGPRLLTFAQAVDEISRATRREIRTGSRGCCWSRSPLVAPTMSRSAGHSRSLPSTSPSP
jgi:uncharacterized protein YbjT (DUF2867 family)